MWGMLQHADIPPTFRNAQLLAVAGTRSARGFDDERTRTLLTVASANSFPFRQVRQLFPSLVQGASGVVQWVSLRLFKAPGDEIGLNPWTRSRDEFVMMAVNRGCGCRNVTQRLLKGAVKLCRLMSPWPRVKLHKDWWVNGCLSLRNLLQRERIRRWSRGSAEFHFKTV